MSKSPVFEGLGLYKTYSRRGAGLFGAKQRIPAVQDISVQLSPGEVVALIGESGSGKSTLGRLVAGIEPPDRGALRFEGQSPARLDAAGRARFRRKVQLIFQDPYDSLDPRYTVFRTVEEPLLQLGLDPAERRRRVEAVLERVGLSPQDRYAPRLPHLLSGGQRQRVAIARALVLNPSVLVADEPTSMLDVSVRIGVVNLLAELARDHGIAVLLITHDLAVAQYIAHRMHVMHLGRFVESGPTAQIISAPQHDYTRALIQAAPQLPYVVPDRHAPRG